MGTRNTSIPTRYRNYQPNWYTVAAVATALQIYAEFEDDILKFNQNNFVDTDKINSISSTTTVTSYDVINVPISVSTTLALSESVEDFEDFAIKPKYIKEFKIRVGSLKVDKSIPKIFID